MQLALSINHSHFNPLLSLSCKGGGTLNLTKEGQSILQMELRSRSYSLCHSSRLLTCFKQDFCRHTSHRSYMLPYNVLCDALALLPLNRS